MVMNGLNLPYTQDDNIDVSYTAGANGNSGVDQPGGHRSGGIARPPGWHEGGPEYGPPSLYTSSVLHQNCQQQHVISRSSTQSQVLLQVYDTREDNLIMEAPVIFGSGLQVRVSAKLRVPGTGYAIYLPVEVSSIQVNKKTCMHGLIGFTQANRVVLPCNKCCLRCHLGLTLRFMDLW
jgi:hypothetical protein